MASRFVVSADNNTTNYPAIKEYLEREAVDGFILDHMDSNIIVTHEI